jgi:predicted dithiol-disulfide oxidoreductase (DUF899 family)
MTDHEVGTLEEWLRAGKELLEPEKELTRRSDLAASFQRGPSSEAEGEDGRSAP